MDIHWLDPSNCEASFPDVEKALGSPNGLLAIGGDLSATRLLNAYRSGIFPWYEEGQPILWWSPNPRGVLYTHKFRISSSLRKTLRKHEWTITFDGDFKKTVIACAAPRSYSRGTWITHEMAEAYAALHQLGHAHSIELWDGHDCLVVGIYGVMIGKMFFGESMFSFRANASKVALAYLTSHLHRWGCPLLDCQLLSPHLCSLGAEAIPRQEYVGAMTPLCNREPENFTWQLDEQIDIAGWKLP